MAKSIEDIKIEILDNFENDFDILKLVIEAFNQDIDARYSDVINAVKSRDIRLIERAAHTLIGAVSNFTKNLVFDVARSIEELALANDIAPIPGLVSELKPEIEMLRDILQNMLKEMP